MKNYFKWSSILSIMKAYNIEVLKQAAHGLLFDMSEEQYQTLMSEFDIVIEQMKIIGENKELDKAEQMVFPFDVSTTEMREDVPTEPLTREEAIRNANNKIGGQIKLPKVVL